MVDFFYRLRHFFLLFALLELSVIFMIRGNSELMWGLRAQTLQLVWKVESSMNWVAELQRSLGENEKLRDENLALTTELARLRIASRENETLRQIIGWQKNSEFETVPADIVLRAPFGFSGHFVLNVGSDQGVEKDMPVISHQGILGRIVHVSNRYSRVMHYLHPKFHVPVMIDTLGTVGILSRKMSEPESLILENIVKTEKIQNGQRVITHYASKIFPPNIPVGTIDHHKKQPEQNFFEITIRPAAPLHTTHHAFVVKQSSQMELPVEEVQPDNS